jgi:uncharacterized repeat protein (TIGR03803 family)
MHRLLLVWLLICLAQKNYAQHELWGMTSAGGKNYLGTIFKANSDGTNPMLQYSFDTPYPGGNPGAGHPVEASNGKLYGLTIIGGHYGKGVLYGYDASTNSYSVMYEFDDANGANPQYSLALHPNGKLYGVTGSGGTFGYGVLFEFDPSNNIYTKKVDFDYSTLGGYPSSSLTLANNNKFYATNYSGGANGLGTLFEYDPVGNTITNKFDFDGSNGANPINNNLVQSAHGYLFGLASFGGATNDGVLYQYDFTTSTFTKKLDFVSATMGSKPEGGMVEQNGFLYGVTNGGGGNDQGTIFKYDETNNVLTDTHDFLTTTDASGPTSGLMISSNGKFYGLVPYSGGVNYINGILYQYDPVDDSFVKKTDFSFFNNSGYGPIGDLVESSSGKLYGTTFFGGLNDYGVLFEFDLTTEITTTKIDFNFAPNGAAPTYELTQHPNGKLYGATRGGGVNGKGVLFEFDPLTNTFTKKFDFDGSANGANPEGSPVLSPNGKLYGCTIYGGAGNLGTLFEFDPTSNSFNKKIDFDGSAGIFPTGGLTLLANGHFTGTTFTGGANSGGTIFDFDPATGLIQNKIAFDPASTGNFPIGSPTSAVNGKFYSGTQQGGANGLGTIYELDTATYSITKVIDLDNSNAGLNSKFVQHPNGKLYGTTTQGGNGAGIIFELDPVSHAYAFKFGFSYNQSDNIGGPPQNLTLSNVDNKLYGVTTMRTTNDKGALFSFDPTTSTYTTIFDFVDSIGVNPLCGLIEYNGKNQLITFNPLPVKTYGDPPFDITATSTSGLTVTFTSSDPAIASVSGNTVTILKGGTVIITVHQPGSAYTNAALDVQQTLTINPADQSIQFNALPDKTLGDAAFTLSATATSGLAITYTSQNNKVTIVGNQVTLVSAGREMITASQSGNESFKAANPVSQSFCINPVKPTITVSDLNSNHPILTSSSSIGNQWYFNGAALTGETNAMVITNQSGNYSVQVTADDCKSIMADNFVLTITDIQEGESISLFPNPTSDYLFIKGVSSTTKEIVIIDVTGNQSSIQVINEQETARADVRNFSPGLYFLKITDQNQVMVYKFVKH